MEQAASLSRAATRQLKGERQLVEMVCHFGAGHVAVIPSGW